MIVATAGHVDHGKTLLVKALTGVDTDRLPEEKARGLSIDLGFAFRDLGDGEMTGFIDVPGHERFIRTMVAGVSGTDVVLFVIAADDGPMPQTEEHLAILDLLGIERGIVALNKIDRVSGTRVAEAAEGIRGIMAGSSLAACEVLPVSAATGQGIEALRAALVALKRTVPARPRQGNFRLAIDRSFVLKGAGRVVTGTVFSGEAAVGETVYRARGDGELRVRGIYAQDQEAAIASVGQRCALNITGPGLRDGEIRRGDWIVSPAANFGTSRVDASIRILRTEKAALRQRTPVHLHVGAAETTGRIMLIEGNYLEPGATGLVQIHLDREIHTVRGDRIILRDQSARRTVGGGVILNPLPGSRRRHRIERLATLAGMRQDDPTSALAALLRACPEGIALNSFAQAWNLRDDEAAALWSSVPLVAYAALGELSAIDLERWRELTTTVVAAIDRLHAEEPGKHGFSIAELRRATPTPISAALLNALLDALLKDETVVRENGLLRLARHAPARDPKDELLWQRVRALLDAPDYRVPVVHDMLAPLGMTQAALETFLLKFAQQGQLVRVSAKRYFLPAMMEEFATLVRDLGATRPGGRFSAADFRDRSGVGRNAVIEILEYFDRTGLTRRQGDLRIVLKTAP